MQCHKYNRPMLSVKVKFITDKPMAVNEANIGRYRYTADTSVHLYFQTYYSYLEWSMINHALTVGGWLSV